MEEQQHHEELVSGIQQQLKEVFNTSEQAIYLYLDDEHKVCNKKFATLLGYKSPNEWATEKKSMISISVDEKSQGSLVSAYRNAMEKCIGSQISVTWKRKDGGQVKTTVIIVPISFSGHLFALHFITKV
jgi:hypothetical protein